MPHRRRLLPFQALLCCHLVLTWTNQAPWVALRLDKTKFYVVGAGIFSALTVGLYPISVVKTRLQVATKDSVEKNAYAVIRGLLKTEGIPGFYRGFATVITGAIPVRIVLLSALETTKAAIANGIAGLTSSLCAQFVFVPVDVISQRLMVQGYSGHASYNGGLDVARKVLKQDGIRGLYRGFGLSVMTYSPSSAVWWASYGSSQRVIWNLLGHGSDGTGSVPSQGTVVLVQGAGGIFCWCRIVFHHNSTGHYKNSVTVCCSCLFWYKVMKHENRPSTRQVIKALIAEDGWKGSIEGLVQDFLARRHGEHP
ncbi:putative mitochondrial carrier domain superfamily [Helianthus debilis subsp. tardiflorus]